MTRPLQTTPKPQKRHLVINIDSFFYFSVIVLLIPFVQLGITYYASFASLILATTLLFIAHKKILTPLKFISPIFIAFLLATLPYIQHNFNLDSYLRSFRELFFASLFIIFLFYLRTTNKAVALRPPATAITVVVIAELVIVVMQLYFLSKRQYFGIDPDLFVNNAETIPGALDLYYSRLRPFGTFGEPSYLAFIMLTIMVMLYGSLKESRQSRTAFGLSVVVGLLSQSMAFVVFGVLIFLPAIIKQFTKIFGRYRDIFLFCAGLLATIVIALLPRTQQILSGNDDSLYIRLISPVALLPDYIVANPFGAPPEVIYSFFVNSSSKSVFSEFESVDNAILGLIYSSGILSAFVLFGIFRNIKSFTIGAYVFAALNFNGAFFSIDKMPLVILAILAFSYSGEFSSGLRPSRALN